MKYTSQQLQAYNALRIAAERMGANGYAAEVRKIQKRNPRWSLTDILNHQTRTKRSIYTPTGEHCAVIESMSKVLSGEIDPEEAMALLNQYDVMKQRIGE